MIIGVAGPYSSPDEAQRTKNLEAMNEAAARLLERGHTPLIGINVALPIVRRAEVADEYDSLMRISLAVISCCEALLVLGESPGVTRERALVIAQGGIVYYSLEEVPDAQT